MGCYRRAKLLFDIAFRRGFTSRVFTRPPVHHSSSRVIQRIGPPIPASNTNKSSGLASSSLISHRLLFFHSNTNRLNIQCNSLNNCVGKRVYNADRYQVRRLNRWFQNPRNVLIALGSGVLITVYFWNLETIPYSKRTHVVIFSKDMEREIGETNFEEKKDSFKGRILPASHPKSIRVNLIVKDILAALQKDLEQEQVILSGGEVVVDDHKWIQESRKKGGEKGKKPSTSHLERLNWEVLVVDKPVVNSFCLPGGKIVVYTGLLELFRSDAEIATVIGHEVGHVVARHGAERITKHLWAFILSIVLVYHVSNLYPRDVKKMTDFFFTLPFSRKMEKEADYIGLLLMASAGYDHRIAPGVYEKLGEEDEEEESALEKYLSTHPSGKKRAKLLAKAKVMEEALIIYRETQSGHRIES